MERRAAPRDSVLRAGTILVGNDSINCMALNMSVTGAMLGLTSPVDVPEHFTLILSPDGRHMSCHVIWRTEKQMGVAFE
jgi:PilZ domain